MFGKSNQDKSIENLKDEITILKADIKSKFQKLDWANNLIQLKELKSKFETLQLELKAQINQNNKDEEFPFDNIKLPNIPWINEIIEDPKGEHFQVLSNDRKFLIWQDVLNNIGFENRYNPEDHLSLYFDPIEMNEMSIEQLGFIHLSHIGSRFEKEHQTNHVITFGDFKIPSDDYKLILTKLIKLVDQKAKLESYNQEFNQETQYFTISYLVNGKQIKFEVEGLKYLDDSFILKALKSIENEWNNSRNFYWISADIGSVLVYVNHYQKTILEKLFHQWKGMKALEFE